jgi:hypothetical protein
MYSRILNLILNKISPEREMAKRLLAWIIWALTTSQMMDVIQHYKTPLDQRDLTESDSIFEDDLQYFQEAAVLVCASLVELADNKLRLIHQSVAEFLKTPSADISEKDAAFEYFKCFERETQGQLAMECFQYLHCWLPARPLSGDMRLRADPGPIRKSNAFIGYSLQYWAQHLFQASLPNLELSRTMAEPRSTRALGLLQDILSNQTQVMAWLEAQYLLTSKDGVKKLLNQFEQYLNMAADNPDDPSRGAVNTGNGNSLDRLRRLHQSFSELHNDWGLTLSQNPHFIWNDITAFTRSEFWKSTGTYSTLEVLNARPIASGEPPGVL